MPCHLAVPPLRSLAAQVALTTLVTGLGSSDHLGEDCDLQTQLQQLYLTAVPATICQHFLHSLLSCVALTASQRHRCMQLLLSDAITCLSVGPFPVCYHPRVLSAVSEQGGGLTSLDLRGLWVKRENEELLCDALKRLPLLTVLRMPHLATDKVLETIGRHNAALRVLDVSGESPFTRHGVESLCSRGASSRLEVVSVGRPGADTILDPSTVSLLIQHLPHLTSLGCYAHTGRALSCLPETVSSLRYLRDTGTDAATMRTIARRCPHLESICLDRPADTQVVTLVGSMTSLREIKLSRFPCCDVEQLLSREGGGNVVTLNLVIGHGILDVSKVARRCPALRTLQCYKVELLVHFEEETFPCLHKLDLFYSAFSIACLRYLVASSPQLSSICLFDNAVTLSNSSIIDIFSRQSYDAVRSLRISSAPLLTRGGLDAIICKCPNLERLGYLDTWGLSPSDVEELQANIRRCNWDLTLES